MNDIESIRPAVEIIQDNDLPYALMHCTSMYPTPYEAVRLGGISELSGAFPKAILGLSDHSLGNYTCFAAIGLGASIVEKHFTSDKSWPGPDVPISIDPEELKDLIMGTAAIHAACGGKKTILAEEAPTIAFAYATVVSIADIAEGEALTKENTWVKRPGTGEIKARDFRNVLGRRTNRAISADQHISWSDLT